ncbi:hypothetical protein KQI22_03695 [Kineothrix sp. MSJ-39]|uniref:DUF6077 domain-containing protein n=1 Tax=Kineothrix sp. MSJ-39 TaxID=2841533 RepID=UPI001C0F4055|nr:DUF6077 domain-containing protein [Kineothrix sp. MSJ-39]MBU5429172.1 hypothetical protein [Kineothrix sp. MSJ-39]
MPYLILFMILVAIPVLLGLIYYDDNNRTVLGLCKAWCKGTIAVWAVFELVYIPCYFLKVPYRTFCVIFTAIMILLVGVLIWLSRVTFFRLPKQKYQKKQILLFFLVFVCICLIAAVPSLYEHQDDDDAYYIAAATTAQETNTMYRYSPYTGEPLKQVDKRYALSPFPVYLAYVSSVSGLPPVILAHRILPGVYILLAFAVAACMGHVLLKGNTGLYMLLFLLLSVWSGFSDKNTTAFLMLRAWQGKALLAAVILPMVWMTFLEMADRLEKGLGVNNKRIVSEILPLSLAGAMVSSMGIMLVPLLTGVLSVVFMIQIRSLKKGIWVLCQMTPSILLGVIYLLM